MYKRQRISCPPPLPKLSAYTDNGAGVRLRRLTGACPVALVWTIGSSQPSQLTPPASPCSAVGKGLGGWAGACPRTLDWTLGFLTTSSFFHLHKSPEEGKPPRSGPAQVFTRVGTRPEQQD